MLSLNYGYQRFFKPEKIHHGKCQGQPGKEKLTRVSMAIYLSCNKVFNESDIASKINLAKEMLTHTNKTIKEIALELGFENNDYFFTVFRRTAGVTPVNYRKITQGGIFSEDIK